MPAVSALMWFSIFIASSTSTRLAGLDGVAHRDEHLHDRALHRRGDRAAADAPRSPTRRRGRGRAGRVRSALAVPPAARRASQSFTVKRLPSTSTGQRALDERGSARRRRRGGGGVGRARLGEQRQRRPRPRPTWWSASPAAKSGCPTSATCAGIVVCTPAISSSPSARSMRARSRGRGREPRRRACRSGCRSTARRCRPRRSRRPSARRDRRGAAAG